MSGKTNIQYDSGITTPDNIPPNSRGVRHGSSIRIDNTHKDPKETKAEGVGGPYAGSNISRGT